MPSLILPLLLAGALTTSTAVTAFAQQGAAAPATPAAPVAPAPIDNFDRDDAFSTREQLSEILRAYPPALGEVLRRDPSLLTTADYITPYPRLVAFLQRHPEVARNPSFYFDTYRYGPPQSASVNALEAVLGGLAGFAAFVTVIGVFSWLIRSVLQHRRWLKLSAVQADVHTRLMDRMTTNDELLAYIQSPAGRRFLESSPLATESEMPRHAAPVGPIIWSMMAGIVLATVGLGFRYSAASIADEAAQAFTVVGVIVLALGFGFILASVMAYVVSSRLGLFPKPAELGADSGHA